MRKQKRSSGSVRCRRCRWCAAWSTCCAPECCFQEQQSCADNTRKTFQVLIKSANVNWRRTSGAFLHTFKTTTTTTTTNSLYQEFGKLLFPIEWVHTGYTLHPSTCLNALSSHCFEFSSCAIWYMPFGNVARNITVAVVVLVYVFYYYNLYFWFYKSNEIRKISYLISHQKTTTTTTTQQIHSVGRRTGTIILDLPSNPVCQCSKDVGPNKIRDRRW